MEVRDRERPASNPPTAPEAAGAQWGWLSPFPLLWSIYSYVSSFFFFFFSHFDITAFLNIALDFEMKCSRVLQLSFLSEGHYQSTLRKGIEQELTHLSAALHVNYFLSLCFIP